MVSKLPAKKTPASKNVPTSVRFDKDHLARAEKLAKRKGVTIAAIIQMALAEKLEREEAGQH